jgi:glycosyltransferase involved in cell wall biosynthesis
MQPVGHGAAMTRFTVLTATFNRAHTLSRVFQSLCTQTFSDFEWLVVDDCSTDNTGSVVAALQAPFRIRYIRIPKGGKHAAINTGVAMAAGEFIVMLDDDDTCEPTALSRFDYHWRQIEHPQEYSTLSVMCRTAEGTLCGTFLPESPVDANGIRDFIRLSAGVERWGMTRTDILRQFPFPEGEPFVIEGLIWNRIIKRYKVRFVNDPLLIVHRTHGSLSIRGRELLVGSPRATFSYFSELAMSPIPIRARLKAAANALRFGVLSLPRLLHRS